MDYTSAYVFFFISHLLVGTKIGRFYPLFEEVVTESNWEPDRQRNNYSWTNYYLGTVEICENCWINRNCVVHGNDYVKIGDNCGIAPDVTCLTGGHDTGTAERRTGSGWNKNIEIRNACRISARSTILGNVNAGNGVVASCACVNKKVPENVLAPGVPAKMVKRLDGESSILSPE